MTGYSANSGGFNNGIGKLISSGIITRQNGKLAALNASEFEDSNMRFNFNNIRNVLGKCENEILDVLVRDPAHDFSKEDLAIKTQSGYSPTSGGFNNSLGRLNSLGLIQRSNGSICLSNDAKEIINV